MGFYDAEQADEFDTSGQGAEVHSEFAIEDKPVTSVRRVSRKARYPFDRLEVGQSFFVPATKGRPNPKKSLASTITSASSRYREQTGTKTVTRVDRDGGTYEKEIPVWKYHRRFRSELASENGVEGIRIGRVAV